jgi:hypothetical protein
MLTGTNEQKMTAHTNRTTAFFYGSILLLLVCSFQYASVRDVKWTVYEAADNGATIIRIKDEGYGIAAINLFQTTATGWETTEILSIDIIQEYVKVKSVQTGNVFELFIDWELGKIVLIDDKKNEQTYWKVKT